MSPSPTVSSPSRTGFLVISPSLECNNHCVFCYSNYSKQGSHALAPVDEIVDHVLSMSEESGVRSVAVSGGEPMLYPDLAKFIRKMKDNGLFVCVMTNGRLLHRQDRLQKLLDVGVDHFHIPVHSDREETHDAITNAKGSFKQTIAGLINVHKAKITGTLGLTIVHVTHAKNYQRLAEFAKFISQFQPDHTLLSYCIIETTSPEEQLALLVDFEKLQSHIAQAHEAFQLAGVDVFVENIPLCAMRGLESICVDFHKFNRLSVGGFKAAGERSSQGFKPFEQSIKSGQRTHATVCRGCAIKQFCGGIYRSYVAAFGEPALRPYTVDELRKRQASVRIQTAPKHPLP